MSSFITITLCCYVFYLYKNFQKLVAVLEREFEGLQRENTALHREIEEIRAKLYLMDSK